MIKLETTKPEQSKSRLKALRSKKWEHADEVIAHFKSNGFEVQLFNPNGDTPHIRIGNVDYWPATSIFIDLNTMKYGSGFDDLKEYLQSQSI